MPKKLERKLKMEAEKKGFTGERKNAYIYGTIDNIQKRQKRKRSLVH